MVCVKSEYTGFKYFVLGPYNRVRVEPGAIEPLKIVVRTEACDDKQRIDDLEEYLTVEREPASIVADRRVWFRFKWGSKLKI